MTAIGLMSGTSMDGIDAAVVTTDGATIGELGPALFTPYEEGERAALRAALVAARGLHDRDERPPALAAAERIVTDAHAAAVARLRAAHPEIVPDLVGFHGQTVLHAPERRLTVQIGDGAALARALGVPVMYDLRAADVAAGGEGAPLVPAYHRALAEGAGLSGTIAIVNIGGVANFTRIAPGGDLIAADTGPGNALIDDFVRARTGSAMDEGGRLAARGQVHGDLVARWMANPWFERPAPKSLDRDAFGAAAADVAELSTEDGAATLASFTSVAIVKGIVRAGGADRLIVVGGGARNPFLLKKLAEDAGIPVETGESLHWRSDFIEAQAFAFLAVRARHGLPITFPGTTGVPRPLGGGRLAEA